MGLVIELKKIIQSTKFLEIPNKVKKKVNELLATTVQSNTNLTSRLLLNGVHKPRIVVTEIFPPVDVPLQLLQTSHGGFRESTEIRGVLDALSASMVLWRLCLLGIDVQEVAVIGSKLLLHLLVHRFCPGVVCTQCK